MLASIFSIVQLPQTIEIRAPSPKNMSKGHLIGIQVSSSGLGPLNSD